MGLKSLFCKAHNQTPFCTVPANASTLFVGPHTTNNAAPYTVCGVGRILPSALAGSLCLPPANRPLYSAPGTVASVSQLTPRAGGALGQICVHRSLTLSLLNVGSDRLCGLVVRVPGCRHRSLVRIPALPDFLRSSGSETGSTQPL
jgi:hypothetical protein